MNTAAARKFLRPVHPRGCGEHAAKIDHSYVDAGSSPRMRGTSVFNFNPADDLRFIPADAGNMHQATSRFSPPPVHPRGCGEHENRLLNTTLGNGSSPRMRGTYVVVGVDTPQQRFIPADAGNM